MPARIFQPARSAMQSGKAGSGHWVLEFEPASGKMIDPLTGYTGSQDPWAQIRMTFATLEEAEAYARRKGLEYQVSVPSGTKPSLRSYADNFRADRIGQWTH